MNVRTLVLRMIAAGAILPLAVMAFVEPAPPAQASPRIIQIPEAKPEPKIEAPQAQKKPEVPEANKPPFTRPPATPSARKPLQPNSNRRIGI